MLYKELIVKNPYITSIKGIKLRLAELQVNNDKVQKIRIKEK